MRNIITGEDWTTLERDGKLEPRNCGTIHCYFCKAPITETATDARDIEMPTCSACGIYYEPQWILQEGHLAIRILPRTHHYQHTEPNAIAHATEPQTEQPQAETRHTEPENKPPEHKDVSGQIRTLMHQHSHVTTQQLANNIDASRQAIDNALKKLIGTGEIQKIKRGVYQVIKMNTNP